jgi:hypothetical protein
MSLFSDEPNNNDRRQNNRGDEIPFGDYFDKELRQFNRKAAGALAPVFVRSLTNATEIFLRKDLGERFFSGAMSGGILIWGLASCLTYCSDSLVGEFLHNLGQHSLAQILGNHVVGLILNIALLGTFMYFASENAKRLQQFRADGRTYHSMSRGVPRWSNDPITNFVIQIGIFTLLLLFAPITAVLFGFSRYLSAAEAAKQEAAKIEGEHLNDALLGKCAPEITYLYKPLPTSMKSETRENIAAAATGKPVKIIAQTPLPTTGIQAQCR